MKSLKKIVVIAVAFLVFLGTLGLEKAFAGPVDMSSQGHLTVIVPAGSSVDLVRNGATQTLNGNTDQELTAGDTVQSKSSSGVEIHFSDQGVVRLSQNTTLNVDVLNSAQDAYVLDLKTGRVWVNSLYTSAIFNLVANGAYLIPDYAAFDVNLDTANQKTLVYANRHQVVVGLVPLSYKAQTAFRFPDSTFINSYLLPEGNQTTVFSQKITQDQTTLSKLFYSKLVKEFPFGIIDPQQLSGDTWLQSNIQSDKTLATTIDDQSSAQIRNRGLKISDVNNNTFSQAVDSFYNFLTFSQQKLIARTNDDIFGYLDDAKYLLLFGQNTSAQEHLDFFKKSLDSALASQGQDYKNAALQRLHQEYDELSYVNLDNPLAPAKTMVTNYLLAQMGESSDNIQQKFLMVRNTMNSVYDLADSNSQSVYQAIENYFSEYTQLVSQEKSYLNTDSNILAEENQIMNNLLLQYPVFYQDRYFAMKNQLEQDWLALLPEGPAKNDEKQTIISTKIDFLNKLKTFFLADQVNVNDAKQIVFRLFHEADVLQLPVDQQVAVNQLFDQRLTDFGVFYQYLNSPEYVATTLHGSARDDQFAQFVQAQQEQVSIEQIRQEILGSNTQQTLTPDQVVAQAQQDFSSIGASNVEFGSYTDVTQTLIPVTSAFVAGVNISAQYDWGNKLVSQIYNGDTLISSDPVALQNLGLLLQTKTQTQQQVPVQLSSQAVSTPTPAPVLSRTELVAEILLMQKLKGFDIATTQDAITINDLGNSLFSISNANLISNPLIKFSFDVDGASGVVTNLVFQASSGPQPIAGTLNLSDVSAQLNAAAQQTKSTS